MRLQFALLSAIPTFCMTILRKPNALALPEIPQLKIVHYVGLGHTHGEYAGNFLVIVVKWLPEPAAGMVVGYVRTIYVARRLQSRLELRERPR